VFVAQAVDNTLIREKDETDLHAIFCVYQLDNDKSPIGLGSESAIDVQLPTPSALAPTLVWLANKIHNRRNKQSTNSTDFL